RYLMQLYAWSGQRAAAMHQFRDCVKILNKELNVSPLEATREIYEAIKENRLPSPPAYHRQPPSSLRTASTANGSSPSVVAEEPHVPVLPSGNYPLVGREEDWARLVNIYAETAPSGYVVVLEGEAGIGKTRLAEEFVAYARSRGSSAVTVRC